MRVCWKSPLECLFQSVDDELIGKLSNLVGELKTLMSLNMPLQILSHLSMVMLTELRMSIKNNV